MSNSRIAQNLTSALCPCGAGAYSACCQPFLQAEKVPPTALQLMRSRYSAYVLGLEPYLLATWHVSTRPASLDLNEQEPSKWLGLEVKRSVENGDVAEVEFVARYKHKGGPAHRMHEISQFVKENGHWFYVDGDLKSQ